jgi:hypothetical protein
VFTDSPLPLAEAAADRRRHAIVEQVFADLEDSALGQEALADLWTAVGHRMRT